MKAMTEEQRIYNRYIRCGCTLEFIHQVVKAGKEQGLTHKGALIGLRMSLGEQCGVQEYFTPEEVAEVLGVSVEEINRTIEENKDELIANGGLAEVSFTPPKGFIQ